MSFYFTGSSNSIIRSFFSTVCFVSFNSYLLVFTGFPSVIHTHTPLSRLCLAFEVVSEVEAKNPAAVLLVYTEHSLHEALPAHTGHFLYEALSVHTGHSLLLSGQPTRAVPCIRLYFFFSTPEVDQLFRVTAKSCGFCGVDQLSSILMLSSS